MTNSKEAISKAAIKDSYHNIKAVKKLIYETLINDSILTGLVPASNIFQSFPATTQINHPAIFYNIISDQLYPYNENDLNSKFSEVTFGIEIVDDSSNSVASDDIQHRVFQLFNGKILKNADVIFKQACKRSYYFQYFDSEIKIWRTVTRYQTVTAPV